MNVLAQGKRTVLVPIKDIKYTFQGAIGDRIDANIKKIWSRVVHTPHTC